MSKIRELLKKQAMLLLDGGMGTQLQANGMTPQMNPARFCLDRQDVVKKIHQAYARAGADIVLTSTFGGNSFKLPADIDVVAYNKAMAQCARQAMAELSLDRPLFVAGDIGPTGHFIQPLGEVSWQDMVESLRMQARGLAQGGVDAIIIETQFDLAETRAAVAAVRMECDLPIFVSMTFEDGVSLTGSTPEVYATTMTNMGVDAIGVNCGAGPEQMLSVAQALMASCHVPVFAEPNAGLPELVDGETLFRLPPDAFAASTFKIAQVGARMLGGCCGTTPEHIYALRQAVQSVESILPQPRQRYAGICLTSRSSLVRIGGKQAITVIGERINPTGKKLLSTELQAGHFDLALRYAAEQVDAGARVLDVNVGAAHVKEEECLPELVSRLVARFTTPLVLDSPNPEALAQALPIHPGSALINSISGEPGRMEKLGPLCRIWGSPYILLPLSGGNLPATAKERIAIIEDLLTQADALGLPRYLALVDVLALTAASESSAPDQCLETIRWCVAQGLPTTVGLSNISFGLPARDLVNSAFLTMAAGAGLSSCIGNPANTRLMESLHSANVLLGRDDKAQFFISRYAQWKAEGNTLQVQNSATTLVAKNVQQAVILGDKENVVALVQKELDKGMDAFALVQELLIPAITEVGAKYESKEYFLPQLLRSAETMQTAFAYVKPLLEENGTAQTKKVIVIATVEGDIHDIGKNIVGLMLGNHGFEVIDLGKDVKAQDIVDAAEKHKAVIVGLSALMTTTMPKMQDTVNLVRDKKLPCKVIVGGAVVTAEYASSIGADGYSSDAVDAVRLAKRLLG